MSEAAFKKNPTKQNKKKPNKPKPKTVSGCEIISLKFRRLKTKVLVVSATPSVVVVCQEGDGPDDLEGLSTDASGREEK